MNNLKSKRQILNNLSTDECNELKKAIGRNSIKQRKKATIFVAIFYCTTALLNSNLNAIFLGVFLGVCSTMIVGRLDGKLIDYAFVYVYSIAEIYSFSTITVLNLSEIIITLFIIHFVYIRMKIYHLGVHKIGYKKNRKLEEIVIFPVTLIAIYILNNVKNIVVMNLIMNLGFIVILIMTSASIFNYHFKSDLKISS